MPGGNDPSPAAVLAAAVELVYREHYAPCRHLAVRVLRDPHLAEDVVQDVFMMLWNTGTSTYRPDQGQIGPWLRTIVHHKAVDRVRSEQTRRRYTAAAAQPDRTRSDAVHDAVWSQLRSQELLAALAVLPPAQHQVLSLAYLAGLTQTEISMRTGVPLGTVKARTRAGLLRLRAALAPTETEPQPTVLVLPDTATGCARARR